MLIRLHKYLADHGVGSRRKCEEYIRKGMIKVNGQTVTEMGVKIDPEKDKIETSSQLSFLKQKMIYLAFNKPVGYVSTVSGEEKPKITDLLSEIEERVFPVGRLDKLTSGLLLLTNDGRFAYELIHPKFEKEKEYVLKVREKVTPVLLGKMNEEFYIHGKKTKKPTIEVEGPHLLRIILREGRNRQIRRMCRRVNLHIEKLKRIRIANIKLGTLPVGKYRFLTKEELKCISPSL